MFLICNSLDPQVVPVCFDLLVVSLPKQVCLIGSKSSFASRLVRLVVSQVNVWRFLLRLVLLIVTHGETPAAMVQERVMVAGENCVIFDLYQGVTRGW